MQIQSLILPNQEIESPTLPVVSILLGGVLKFGLGGSIFDLIGHLIIFVGSINIFYFLRRGREDKLNFLIGLIIVGLLFIGAQIAMHEVVRNILGIKPLLQ